MLRLSRVLKPYRGWPDAEQGSRWGVWLDAIEGDENVKATTSGDELYLDSYERYAGMYSCPFSFLFFSFLLRIFAVEVGSVSLESTDVGGYAQRIDRTRRRFRRRLIRAGAFLEKQCLLPDGPGWIHGILMTHAHICHGWVFCRLLCSVTERSLL